MVTQQQAIDWLHAQKGKALDYDGAYGCQCADYFNYYFQYISNGVSPYAVFGYYEGAKDLWVQTDYFDLIPDSDTLFPLPGDVFIYGASWGGGYGHVDMCIVSDANGSTYSGQNENGNPYNTCVTEGYRTWAQQSGLTGVMRPKFSVEAPAPEPAPEVPTPPVLTLLDASHHSSADGCARCCPHQHQHQYQHHSQHQQHHQHHNHKHKHY